MKNAIVKNQLVRLILVVDPEATVNLHKYSKRSKRRR